MRAEQFNQVFEEAVKRSRAVLVKKTSEYGPQDVFHNSRASANLQGISLRKGHAGKMGKHTVSVYDLCMATDCAPLEVWDEKIIDHINYLILLRGIVVEELEGES